MEGALIYASTLKAHMLAGVNLDMNWEQMEKLATVSVYAPELCHYSILTHIYDIFMTAYSTQHKISVLVCRS